MKTREFLMMPALAAMLAAGGCAFCPALEASELHGPVGPPAAPSEPAGAPAQGEEITVARPPLSALISVRRSVDPLLLDAATTTELSLGDVSRLTVEHNLDIGIANLDERIKNANLLSSLGKFLPNVSLGYQQAFLKGRINAPVGLGPDPIRFNNPFILTSAGLKCYGYRGGSVLFTVLRNRNTLRAARHARHATISDALLQGARLYYDLVLQEALLQIRIQAVETSAAQLELNQNLKQGGMATSLDVLQAETQLSGDRQNLVDQQVARREAAIKLAEFLDAAQGEDIVPISRTVRMVRLVSVQMPIAGLVQAAIDNRPELKQYEELRLAARKAIVLAGAQLQPTLAFNNNVFGIGETLDDAHRIVPVISTLQPVTLAGSGTTQFRRVSRQISALYSVGFAVNWNFEGLGAPGLADIQAARLQARQALLQQHKVLDRVMSEVRRSYLETMSTETNIAQTSAQVRSAGEELDVAQLRFRHGLGKNLDILKAQQDSTTALINKARAIVNFDIAQVQLLHDIGLLSLSTLTAETPYQR